MNFALADIQFLTPNSHNSTKRRWYEMFFHLFEPYFSTDLGKRWRKCCACYHPRYFFCWYWICQTLAIFWHKFSKIWLTSVKHSIAGSWIFFKCGKTRNLEQPQSCTAERKSNQRKPLGNNTSATGYAIHRVCKRYCRKTNGSLVKLYPARHRRLILNMDCRARVVLKPFCTQSELRTDTEFLERVRSRLC